MLLRGREAQPRGKVVATLGVKLQRAVHTLVFVNLQQGDHLLKFIVFFLFFPFQHVLDLRCSLASRG